MSKMKYRFPLDDDFYVVENEVAIKILEDGIHEYVWYLTGVGDLVSSGGEPKFYGHGSGNDELIYFSRDNAEDGNDGIKLVIEVLLSSLAIKFHIKLPERELAIFMLKYGGIIKKSPSYVYYTFR